MSWRPPPPVKTFILATVYRYTRNYRQLVCRSCSSHQTITSFARSFTEPMPHVMNNRGVVVGSRGGGPVRCDAGV